MNIGYEILRDFGIPSHKGAVIVDEDSKKLIVIIYDSFSRFTEVKRWRGYNISYMKDVGRPEPQGEL
jgi:hypothetical protein